MNQEERNTDKSKIKNFKPYIAALLIFVLFALLWNSVLKNIDNSNPIVKNQDSLNNESSSEKPELITSNQKLKESYIIGELTTKMDLNVEEAQKFWPLYNEFRQKNDSLSLELKITSNRLENSTNDDSLPSYVDKYNELIFLKAKLRNDYHYQYKEVLSVEKLAKYYLISNNRQ